VRAQIFDARGALVRTIEERVETSGSHDILWDGRGREGTPVASGVYWMRLDAPGGTAVRKVAFLR